MLQTILMAIVEEMRVFEGVEEIHLGCVMCSHGPRYKRLSSEGTRTSGASQTERHIHVSLV
jgi:hypothetical protein